EAAELRVQSGVPPGSRWPTVRAALCKQVRDAIGFDRSRYLDARKENQTKTELAAFRGDMLGFGRGFALANLVDGPSGLRALGFELRSSFARDDFRREKGGALALLLGEVNRRGKAVNGVEERLEIVLSGKPGEARVAADGVVTVTKAPEHGRSVILTISLPLQNAVQALLDKIGGAAVVDVRTGGILALATWPAPSEGEASSAVAELTSLKKKGHQLSVQQRDGDEEAEGLLAAVRSDIRESRGVHRAITSETNVPPGSTMKALTLLAALEAGVINPAFEIDCQNGQKPHGFGCERHGRVDLEGAIERSCNEYCYQAVGLLGGSKRLFALYDKIGLFDEVPGLVGPSAGRWMREAIVI